MLRNVIAAALCVVSSTAYAGNEIKSSRVFDIYVENVKNMYSGLTSYGVDSAMAYSYANSWIGQTVFGWNMSMGTASSWHENNPDVLTNGFTNGSVEDEWAAGWTGKGIRIQVRDSYNTEMQACNPYQTVCISATHGELVARIAGGVTDNEAGIAPEAKIKQVSQNSKWKGIGDDIEIMNMSYGQWQPNGGTDWGIRHNLNKMHKSEDAKGTLIVTSAGNMGDFSHNDRINNGILKSKYKSSTLIVGALNTNDDNIANWSNKAGKHKWNFVVDKGLAQFSNGEQFGGTSAAAPMVSGKAALLMQKYPELSAKKTANLIKFTATDLGAVGVDSVYGYGKINLSKAMSPFGDLN